MVHILIEELENFAHENKVPIMQKDGIEFLIDYIKKNNVINILEIGTAIGYSSIRMALLDKNIKITTIERNDKMFSFAVNNIKKIGLDNQIKVIHDDALNVSLNEKFDLIFIDAAKSQYIKFFNNFKDNLEDNGVIISDNLSFHGLVSNISNTNNRNTKQLVRKIKNYIEFLKTNNEYETTFYELGDGVAITKKA